jgi:hypothetical protein
MHLRTLCAAIVATVVSAGPVWAQFKQGGEEKPGGIKIGDKYEISRWQAGLVVKAVGGACKGISGYVPVPYSWPEQEVTIIKSGEEVSPEVKISYETVDGGARIMNFRIAQLPAGKEVKAIITFEVRRNIILPPDETDGYVFADAKKLATVRAYLVPSPLIESNDPKIRELAKTIGVDKEKAWEHVEAIYDWVRAKIKYQEGPIKGALAGLRDGTGDCEEITSLFIAICRAANIPARSVWVHNHCYPEFYLLDSKGEGHWFPCQSAGSREFGGITELRPILQKGDNFRPPKGGKKRQRYMAEFLSGSPTPGGGRPQVTWVREMLAK